MDRRNKGQEIYELANSIFPFFRSITGKGVRDTLNVLKDYIGKDDGAELILRRVKSGTKVFDWTVPKEWVIRSAYIENEKGEHIIDIEINNLYVLGYSVSVDRWVDLEELKKYIYVEETQPEVIPYVTSYYKERYGFCMSKTQRDNLPRGKYHMYIDSELVDGYLDYGEVLIRDGESDKEVFFSTYICHPSMANNECSGPALTAELVRFVKQMKKRRYNYRFIFIPETIGSLTYMAVDEHLDEMKKTIVAGFNLSCVGDDNAYSMVESRYGNTLADKALKNILRFRGEYTKYSYLKRASDERQYNAPGIDLPVVCYCRSMLGEYPEYHTSADNMEFVSPAGFQGSYEVITDVITSLENNKKYKVNVLGEPQLGKRGLYPTISQKGSYDSILSLIDFIAYADGSNDIIDISDIIGVPVKKLIELSYKLLESNLIEET